MSPFFRALFNRRMLCVFLLGFSSGLPLLLVGATLKAWLTDLQVDLTLVGAFALVQLPYSLKFLWAPVMDRFVPPFLDRRRAWIVIWQILLAAALLLLAFSKPESGLLTLSIACLLIAFFSASQDTAIDAYRREILSDREQGFGASLSVNGYRIGMLAAGAGALVIAQYASWQTAYLCMAAMVAAVILVTLFSPSVKGAALPPSGFREAVVDPFSEFLKRPGAFEILAFVLLFKLGDQMASEMLNPFFLQVGYLKVEIGAVSKVFGLWATIVGGLVGGIILFKVSLYRCLWGFGVLQMVSTFGFSWLANLGAPNLKALALTVSIENFSGGMGTAAYVGFMASLTNRRFTATQYALLTSFMSVPRVFFGSSSGWFAKHFGWSHYFAFCALIAIPGLLMLFRFHRWVTKPGL